MRTQVQDTSIDAFYGHLSKSASQRKRIIAFIEQRRGNWSIGELAQELGLEKSTVSARLNESLAVGELIEAPKRKDRISGIRVRPVRIPPMQMELPCLAQLEVQA